MSPNTINKPQTGAEPNSYLLRLVQLVLLLELPQLALGLVRLVGGLGDLRPLHLAVPHQLIDLGLLLLQGHLQPLGRRDALGGDSIEIFLP